MPSKVSERVAKYRASMRAAGLRPLQIWVPDTSKPGFAEACRRQSRMLHDDPQEPDTLDWIERVADTEGWE